MKLIRTSIEELAWVPPPVMYYGEYAQFLHRALANPDAEVECPDMPTTPCGEDDSQDSIRYWEGAYYIMVYLLGWSNPAKGLHWFYSNGKLTQGSPPLELLRSIYDSNGQLALLAAWLWQIGINNAIVIREGSHGQGVPWQWDDETRFNPGVEWQRAFQGDFDSGRWQGWLPYSRHGGSPLHLGHILHGSEESGRTDGQLVRGETSGRRAALLVDGTCNWYQRLARVGRELPELGDRSWHVDVTSKQLGWLGTFRRSRATGLWFQGKHSVHVQGN